MTEIGAARLEGFPQSGLQKFSTFKAFELDGSNFRNG